MRLYKIIACVFACAVSFAVSAAGDIVVLKGGQKLIGDIVAEKPDRLYVDVGVTVLAVPKQDVLEYHKDKQNEPNNLPAEESTNTEKPSAKSSAGRLYYASDTGKIRTIE